MTAIGLQVLSAFIGIVSLPFSITSLMTSSITSFLGGEEEKEVLIKKGN